jgi:hypothetical protein
VIKCEVCGVDITEEYDDGGESGQCPDCGRYLCHICADWSNSGGDTVCWECDELYEEMGGSLTESEGKL